MYMSSRGFSVGTSQISTSSLPGGAYPDGLDFFIGYNNPITWTQASTPPTTSGVLVADVSFLISRMPVATNNTGFPNLNLRVADVVVGYQLDRGTTADFPTSGTLFLYLSCNGSALGTDGAYILQTIPLAPLAGLVNDTDPNTPNSFTTNTFGSIPASTTSLRLMAYYSGITTPASWTLTLSLGAMGVTGLRTTLQLPPA